jgi:heat shock protein HslJ
MEPPVVEIPTPEPSLPMGTVVGAQGANIRGGPGTNFPIVGFAPAGTTMLITGRNAAGDWYVVSIPTLPSGVGWISAPLLAATNVQDLPVIASPPTPVPTATPVAPTATPTPIPATATPSASISFTADRTQINQGECVTLSWNVQNVTAVWVYPLGANFRDFPVEGQGSRQECPPVTTTYEMRVQLTNGQLELRQVTINVTVTNPLAGSNWVVTQLLAGQVPTGEQPPTLSLGADGTFSGFGGCNTVNGTYTVNGSSISFAIIGSTMMACDESATWIQESFQNALGATAFYDFLGFQLVFRDWGGAEVLRMIATN